MHDLLNGLLFIAIVMTPCVVALTTRLDPAGSRLNGADAKEPAVARERKPF